MIPKTNFFASIEICQTLNERSNFELKTREPGKHPNISLNIRILFITNFYISSHEPDFVTRYFKNDLHFVETVFQIQSIQSNTILFITKSLLNFIIYVPKLILWCFFIINFIFQIFLESSV